MDAMHYLSTQDFGGTWQVLLGCERLLLKLSLTGTNLARNLVTVPLALQEQGKEEYSALTTVNSQSHSLLQTESQSLG